MVSTKKTVRMSTTPDRSRSAVAPTAINPNIRRAKYRVKNAQGVYEEIYLETSADQVLTDDNLQFVSAEEKKRIYDIDGIELDLRNEINRSTAEDSNLSKSIDTVSTSLTNEIEKAVRDAENYTDRSVFSLSSEVDNRISVVSNRISTVEQTVDKNLSDNRGYVDSAINQLKSEVAEEFNELDNELNTLTNRVGANESEIVDIKKAISGMGSNTVVVNTESEIASANPNPKVGDLAYVLSNKRAYIYKGVARSVPSGWVVFDEITTEVDLVNYLKKSEAENTYRKLSDRITMKDLDATIVSEIGDKATKVELNTVDDRITASMPTLSYSAPSGTEVGHVWIELMD
jgi:hypothetical protein